MALFQTSAIVEGISTRQDRTLKITLSTQELQPEQASLLLNLHQKQGWFLFSENELTEKDLPPDSAPEFKSDKSPSQRLRACLYIYWKQNTSKQKPFDTFYKDWTEKKINEIKDTLK